MEMFWIAMGALATVATAVISILKYMEGRKKRDKDNDDKGQDGSVFRGSINDLRIGGSRILLPFDRRI